MNKIVFLTLTMLSSISTAWACEEFSISLNLPNSELAVALTEVCLAPDNAVYIFNIQGFDREVSIDSRFPVFRTQVSGKFKST